MKITKFELLKFICYLSYLKELQGFVKIKKSGTLSQNEMDSALVELAGIEPASKQGI
ncbi:MAG: hypothetical protein VX344_04030 [Bacteroidota bacterium]|nr:hypothetical protein [Bacteroidota bacterium]